MLSRSNASAAATGFPWTVDIGYDINKDDGFMKLERILRAKLWCDQRFHADARWNDGTQWLFRRKEDAVLFEMTWG
jgi:hypothetical protein